MSLATVHPEHGLWHYVRKLLRWQGRILLNDLRRARTVYAWVGLFGLAACAAIFAALFVASQALFSVARSYVSDAFDSQAFLASAPALIVMGVMAGTFPAGIGMALEALYLAGDMDFMLRAPLPGRAVFIAKLPRAALPYFGLASLFGLPLLYSLGTCSRYTLVYYPLAVIVLLISALAMAGVASLLAMSLVHVLPARRAAVVMGAVTALGPALCYIAPFLFPKPGDTSGAQSLVSALNSLAQLNAPWLPMAWAGRGLADLGAGHWLTGAGFLLLSLAWAGLILAAALGAAERLYYSGWANVQAGVRRQAAGRGQTMRPGWLVRTATWLKRRTSAPVYALAAKDWLTLRRDLRRLSSLISSLASTLFLAMIVMRSGKLPTLGAWMAYFNLCGFSIVLAWSWMSLSMQMMNSFAQESKYYWLIKAAPLSVGRILFAKFIVAYLPTLAVGWAFLLVISLAQGIRLSFLGFGLPALALFFAGAVGINLAFGLAGVTEEGQFTLELQGLASSCLGALASFAYMLVAAALFFVPPMAAPMLGGSEAAGQIIGLALGGVVSLACAIVPLWLMRHRVQRIRVD